MTSLLSVSGDAAVFAASFALLFFLSLTLRNPRQARWLDSEAAGQAVALVMTAALVMSFAGLTTGLIDAGLSFWSAWAGAMVFGFAISIFFWRVIRMRVRLDACEEGRAPFHLSLRAGTPSGDGGAPVQA